MMRGLILVCSLWGFTTGLPKPFTSNSVQALPAKTQLQLDHVNTPNRRDYQTPSNHVATNTAHNGYSSGGTNVGHTYYYQPVEEEYGGGSTGYGGGSTGYGVESTGYGGGSTGGYGGGAAAGAAAGSSAAAADHALMTPLLIIIVLLVAILLQLALPGLISALINFVGPFFPAIEFEAITIPVPDGSGRALIDNNLIYNNLISWENLNKLTIKVRSAIEVDECMSRLVCYSSRYADGSNALQVLLEHMPSEEYSSYVKVFKDSALRKVNCNIYKCGILGTKD